MDVGKDTHASAAARTFENIQGPYALHQFGPCIVSLVGSSRRRLRRRCRVAEIGGVAPPTACMSFPGCCFRARMSSTLRTIRGFFQATLSRVVDRTMWGVFSAKCAYSISPCDATLPV